MQLTRWATALLSTHAILSQAASLPTEAEANAVANDVRMRQVDSAAYSQYYPRSNELEKRRGGGGGRGGGSGGGGTGGTAPRPGGTVPSGGSSPTFGGRYAGGGTVPFRAGLPVAGLAGGGLLLGTGLLFWAGASWGPYGAHVYQYPSDITYFNETSGMNETVPGICICQRFQGCSCSPDNNAQELIGNGSYAYLQTVQDIVQVDDVNGTRTLAVNGTLGNDTLDTSGNPAGMGKTSMLQSAVWLGLASVAASAFYLL